MVSFRQLVAASALAVAGQAANHTITAKSDLTFSPNSLTAQQGDWLIFEFEGQNHSVASGPFTSPCQPAPSGGFFSGYFPTSQGTNEKHFAVEVKNASAPIWFYCTQGQHCARGMVGVVNPTAQRTLDMYKEAAAQYAQPAVAPASVAGGAVESTEEEGGAASLTVSMAGLLGLAGMVALMA